MNLHNELALTHPFLAGITAGTFALIVAALALWSLVWKGIALWHSARNYQKAWFVVLLIVNTAGILDIIYLLWFRRDKREETKSLFNNPLPKQEDEQDDLERQVAETPNA